MQPLLDLERSYIVNSKIENLNKRFDELVRSDVSARSIDKSPISKRIHSRTRRPPIFPPSRTIDMALVEVGRLIDE